MVTLNRILDSPAIRRFATHLRDPLYRNGYALVFSSIATSGLGVIYWIVAARVYSTEVVGLNSATISAMTFLAYIAQFNLMNVLNRFIPSLSRDDARRMIIYSYLSSQILAIIVSIVFIYGIKTWEPELGFLGSSVGFVLWLVAAVMTWCIFVMQDSALTGLRQAIWIPFENLFFALMKIGLLVVLAVISPAYGVLASWTISVALTIVPTNVLIFGWLLPRYPGAAIERREAISLPQIVKYVAGDYFGSLVPIAAMNLLPIVIVARISAEANAYFSLALMVAYTFYLVCRNMGMSFIAEAAANSTNMAATSYRLFVNMSRLIVPSVIIVTLGAPYVLKLFGNEYSVQGSTLLRLLCLSALPNIVVSIYTSVVRVQRRVIALFLVQTLPNLMIIILSYILMTPYGVNGIGAAWLVVQLLTAGILLATELRSLWWGKGDKTIQKELKLKHGVFEASKNWREWRSHLAAKRISRLLPQLIRPVSSLVEIAPEFDWKVKKAYRSLGDMNVFAIGPANTSFEFILHFPNSLSAANDFERNLDICLDLQQDLRFSAEWRQFLPEIIYKGNLNGRPYYIGKRLPGISLINMTMDVEKRRAVLDLAFESICYMHRKTAHEINVDGDLIDKWVSNPIRNIKESNLVYYHLGSRKLLDRLELNLCKTFEARSCIVSYVHGDYWPGNILLATEDIRITGLVDWDLFDPLGLPELDLVNLFLSNRQLAERSQLGPILIDVLQKASWWEHENALWKKSEQLISGEYLQIKDAVLVYWVQHTSSLLQKSQQYSFSPFFAYNIFVPIIRYLERTL